jgi:hypothetical protein
LFADTLVFEGDGKIHHSVGDYDYYLEKKQKALAAAERQSAAILATNRSNAAAKEKLNLLYARWEELEAIKAATGAAC